MAVDPRLTEMVARAICIKLQQWPEYIYPHSSTPAWQKFAPAAEAAIAVINRSMNP